MNKDDKIPSINAKATKNAIEKALCKYRDYMLTMPNYLLPKVTATYSLVPCSNTNEFRSKTETAAIERIEYTMARDAFIQEVIAAVNTLKEKERLIIIGKYLQEEVGYDPDIWTELGVGKTKYYQIKGEAMLRLAFALKVEVYEVKRT